MGYFEALTSSSFKTTKSGERLFFPWGTVGRGYVISSDAEFQRLHNRVKVYLVAALPVMIGAVALGGLVGGAVALAIFVVPYIIWAKIQCRRLERARENLTLGESIEAQAREHSIAGLWALEAGSLLFVAVGLFILLVDPTNWLVALAAIVFFGLCAVMFARTLIIRGRTIRTNRS